MSNKSILLPAVLLLYGLMLLGCGSNDIFPMPETKSFLGVYKMTGYDRISGRKVEGLYVIPNPKLRSGRLSPNEIGIAPTDRRLHPFKSVFALLEDGNLLFNDGMDRREPAFAFKRCRLAPGDFDVRSAQGYVGRSSGVTFTPKRDVLASLDKGFVIEISAGGAIDHLGFKPLYGSKYYSDYFKRGRTGYIGRQGSSVNGLNGPNGKGGSNGKRGKSGRAGANNGMPGGRGGRGQDGFNGGNGGNGIPGGHGLPGGHGTRGRDGGPGEKGPALTVRIRPIYSKFYPNEELTYMEITALWRNTRGVVYKRERLNFIFHGNDRFILRTVGGSGGSGGAGGPGGRGGSGGNGGWGGNGGRGGNGGDGGYGGPSNYRRGIRAGHMGPGGNGGNGGRGGNGAMGGSGAIGGRGGNGGNGGRAGDGGDISVFLEGGPIFNRNARNRFTFSTIPGEPGPQGAAGRNGRFGLMGLGGKKGRGGAPGRGGRGYPIGSGGSWGKPGRSGANGLPGRINKYRARPGSPGSRGRTGRIDIRG